MARRVIRICNAGSVVVMLGLAIVAYPWWQSVFFAAMAGWYGCRLVVDW